MPFKSVHRIQSGRLGVQCILLLLVFLTPGVVGGTGNDHSEVTNWAVFGTRRQMMDVVIDGAPAAHPTANGFTGMSIFPSVDAIQEFKLLGANFSAEYGRTVGSVLNIVYKSGTNQFHGTAHEDMVKV